ncbi:hypothetical protein OB960_11670 [Halobacteria archaeon AArc-xg1-1]|nr:hypothetical protein [Halobacteria archaeon AArc-xg1-1]
MVVFLANRSNLQNRRLHTRIKNTIRSEFDDVRMRRTDARDPGPYRVVGDVDPRVFLDEKTYPTAVARVEIGIQIQTSESYEYYWVNWVEPERGMLVGWHQDDTHDEFGPVHIQVTDRSATVDHRPAQFIDSHPLDVVGQRIENLREAVLAVEWEGERPVGLQQSA